MHRTWNYVYRLFKLCVKREVIFIEKKNQVSGLMGFNLNLQSAGLCKLLCKTLFQDPERLKF